MLLLTQTPPVLGVGRVSGAVSYVLCKANLLQGSLLSRWDMPPGQPITVGLAAHDLGRPAKETPCLHKLKPTVGDQWGVKLKGGQGARARAGAGAGARLSFSVQLPTPASVCTFPHYLFA